MGVNKIGHPDIQTMINLLTQEMDPTDPWFVNFIDGAASHPNFGGNIKNVAAKAFATVENPTQWPLPQSPLLQKVAPNATTSPFKLDDETESQPHDTNQSASLFYDAVGYFGKVMIARNFKFMRDVKRIGNPVDRTEWFMSPQTVNAYYAPFWNEIVFPAAILQPPFFQKDFPIPMNFGGIGGIMGHELLHAFDNNGHKFDAKGHQRDWWDKKAKQEFLQRARCVVDFYRQYSIAGHNLSGLTQLGENIADMGGVKFAYRAFKLWQEEHPNEPKPVLPFNDDKMFFLSYAQTWCTKSDPQTELALSIRDPHSPPRFRVNGPLSNNPTFAETFQCAKGTPMNPRKQCDMW